MKKYFLSIVLTLPVFWVFFSPLPVAASGMAGLDLRIKNISGTYLDNITVTFTHTDGSPSYTWGGSSHSCSNQAFNRMYSGTDNSNTSYYASRNMTTGGSSYFRTFASGQIYWEGFNGPGEGVACRCVPSQAGYYMDASFTLPSGYQHYSASNNAMFNYTSGNKAYYKINMKNDVVASAIITLQPIQIITTTTTTTTTTTNPTKTITISKYESGNDGSAHYWYFDVYKCSTSTCSSQTYLGQTSAYISASGTSGSATFYSSSGTGYYKIYEVSLPSSWNPDASYKTINITGSSGSVTFTNTYVPPTTTTTAPKTLTIYKTESGNDGSAHTWYFNIYRCTTSSCSTKTYLAQASIYISASGTTGNTTYTTSYGNTYHYVEEVSVPANWISSNASIVYVSTTGSVSFTNTYSSPPTCTLTANPTTINAGHSTTLSWTTANATTASINQGIGTVAVSAGSRSVSPSGPLTYTMTVSGVGGTGTCSQAIAVDYAIIINKSESSNDGLNHTWSFNVERLIGSSWTQEGATQSIFITAAANTGSILVNPASGAGTYRVREINLPATWTPIVNPSPQFTLSTSSRGATANFTNSYNPENHQMEINAKNESGAPLTVNIIYQKPTYATSGYTGNASTVFLLPTSGPQSTPFSETFTAPQYNSNLGFLRWESSSGATLTNELSLTIDSNSAQVPLKIYAVYGSFHSWDISITAKLSNNNPITNGGTYQFNSNSEEITFIADIVHITSNQNDDLSALSWEFSDTQGRVKTINSNITPYKDSSYFSFTLPNNIFPNGKYITTIKATLKHTLNAETVSDTFAINFLPIDEIYCQLSIPSSIVEGNPLLIESGAAEATRTTGDVTTWHIDWGDGGRSGDYHNEYLVPPGPELSHIYRVPGKKYVKIVVTNPDPAVVPVVPRPTCDLIYEVSVVPESSDYSGEVSP